MEEDWARALASSAEGETKGLLGGTPAPNQEGRSVGPLERGSP